MFNRILIGKGRRLRVAGFLMAITGLLVSGSVKSDAVAVNDAVMEWNQIALDKTVTAGQGPVPQIRSMTIVQVSVHDAVNAITGKHPTYVAAGPAPAGASAEAAAIAAAHRALVTLFPLQSPALDAARAASLAARSLTESDAGIGVGESAAAAILGARSSDGAAQAQYPYTAPGAGTPGVWVTIGSAPALLPGWGSVTTWILPSGSQFRPDGPPSLSSGRYARDYREVQELGSLTNATRTGEQTEIARFWLAAPSPIWNGVARQIIAARGLDVSDSAKVLALMYLASSDASIACFDAKYTFNFWRPRAAIRNGNLDGNDATVGDPGWEPLFPTPPHPEYLSGHSTNSSAMAAILAFLFGDNPGVPIVAISPTNPGFPRQWATFSEGVEEVIDARIYAGIHYRTSDEVGARVGRQVARFVIKHALR
jgi:PAP2 superfamily protein